MVNWNFTFQLRPTNTSKHHNFTTSPHHNIEASQFHNIATSQHRNISTSQHLHIAISQHLHIAISQHLHIAISQHKNMIENTLRINNPATGIKITRVQKDDAESVQQKYQLLKNGQPEWANTPLSERLWCIEQFFRLLDVERVDLAETLTAEMGKPFQEALNEIQGARGRIHFFLNNTSNWLQDEWMIPATPTRTFLQLE